MFAYGVAGRREFAALLCFENNKAGGPHGGRGAIEMSRLADYIDVLREATNDIIPGDRYFEGIERIFLL